MTRHLVISRLWAQFRRISNAALSPTSDQLRSRRRNRQDALECEVLEGRVVLSSGGGGSLLNSLTYIGVVTSPIVVPKLPVGPVFPFAGGKVSTAVGQINSDVQALWTELQTLAAKSDVTIEDLQNLTGDYQSISQAGFHFTTSSLNSVTSELASAVAGGTSTTPAQAAFTALFSGSSVSSTVITSTFNDLVTAITDSQCHHGRPRNRRKGRSRDSVRHLKPTGACSNRRRSAQRTSRPMSPLELSSQSRSLRRSALMCRQSCSSRRSSLARNRSVLRWS